jgi:23S rRNA pseudouridine2605 synthase
VFPVGRLDYDSEGLLLITNDGDFAQAVLHPSKEIYKTYAAKVKGIIDDDSLEKLRRGVRLEDGVTAPVKVRRIRHKSENNSWLEISLYEGRNRQVRRMFDKVGHPVVKLKRTSIGGLRLKDLKPGEFRPLTPEELLKINNEGSSAGGKDNDTEARRHGQREKRRNVSSVSPRRRFPAKPRPS